MKNIHHNEKEQFKKLFEQEKADDIEDRFAILEHFLRTEIHIPIDELKDLLANGNFDFDRQFVKDTLNLMCRFGFARKAMSAWKMPDQPFGVNTMSSKFR